MTTTENLQIKPDYYLTLDDCKNSVKENIVTNERYNYTHTHFTAGDIDQFEKYVDRTNPSKLCKKIDLSENKYKNKTIDISWDKYKDLEGDSVSNTFNYLFNKFKKGIYLKIQDNELKVFLPFSNKNFINEWAHKIKVDPKYDGDMMKFIKYINVMNDKPYYKISINKFVDNWYANNCLLRYEFPFAENDTNITNMCDMLKTLCKNRKIPDIELFLNRRDFPLIKKDETEPYNHIFGNNQKLVSHNYSKYCPILSMVTTDEFSDIPIPTGDDWARISSQESKYFSPACKVFDPSQFTIKWKDKKSIAVFRGASTGCGVTTDTNMRLKVALLDAKQKDDILLDAGISKWQLRPRKLENQEYLQLINIKKLNKMGIKLKSFLTPYEQSSYKYIIHIDGNVSAFRLSYELCMGSCILLVGSQYKLFYSHLLVPMKHYIPIKPDLSDLIEKIKWCRENDETCREISVNAKKFYTKYLRKDGLLDYLQKLFVTIKKETGTYLYNNKTPLQIQNIFESKFNFLKYPKNSKTFLDINKIHNRNYSNLRAIEWIINMLIKNGKFTNILKNKTNIFENKNVHVNKYNISGIDICMKETQDKIKIKENIHEKFIGKNSINNLLKYVPNFVYIFGDIDNKIITECVEGITFGVWLTSNKFNLRDYIFILLQLSLALEIAQRKYGFVHYDLTPWNIVIQELEKPVEFDYMIDSNNIYRVNTKLIPIIIDYGKSHMVYTTKNNLSLHSGYINMFTISTIQDIISILITSVNTIIKRPLYKNDIYLLLNIMNFLANTKYRKHPFKFKGPKGISDIQFFTTRQKSYTKLINSNKHELENLSPINFFIYLLKISKINFPIKNTKNFNNKMNSSNARQIFDFILSSNDDEKLDSFRDIFKRIPKCSEIESLERVFSIYSIQTIEHNITSVYYDFLKFIDKNKNLPEEKVNLVKQSYFDAVQHLRKIFSSTLQKKDENIELNKNISYTSIPRQIYTEKTFMDNNTILQLLDSLNKKKTEKEINVLELREIIEYILVNKGIFQLSEEDFNRYYNNFRPILKLNPIDILSYNSNINTLNYMCNAVYTNNLEKLNNNFKNEKDCIEYKKYKQIYKEILYKTC